MKIKHTSSAEETEFLGYELGLLLKDEPKWSFFWMDRSAQEKPR
jgi:hypothetical protein